MLCNATGYWWCGYRNILFFGLRIDFTLLPGVAYACAGQEVNSILSLTPFCVFLDLALPLFEHSRYFSA